MSLANERHYMVADIATMWKLSPDTIRKIFRNVSGVVKIGSPENVRRRKRGYISLRVPESVLQRVHEELRAKGRAA